MNPVPNIFHYNDPYQRNCEGHMNLQDFFRFRAQMCRGSGNVDNDPYPTLYGDPCQMYRTDSIGKKI